MRRDRQPELDAVFEESYRVLWVLPPVKFDFQLYTVMLTDFTGQGICLGLVFVGLVRIDLHVWQSNNDKLRFYLQSNRPDREIRHTVKITSFATQQVELI
jgi:hypothetical protein